MSEPVKIAITNDADNGITVLSAGVPVHYVYVNFDTEECNTFTVDGAEAVGHTGNALTQCGDYVLSLIDTVSRHEDPDGGRIRDLLCLLQEAATMLTLAAPAINDGVRYQKVLALRDKCQNTINQMNGDKS